MIFAVQMMEHCAVKNHLRRAYVYGKPGRKYEAGELSRIGQRESIKPSPIYVVSEEVYLHLTGKNEDGMYNVPQHPKRHPYVPTFRGFMFETEAELHEYAQKDMETKARLGSPAVRAQIMGPAIITRDTPKPPATVVDKLTGETVKVSLSEQRYPHDDGELAVSAPKVAAPVTTGEEMPGSMVDIMADLKKDESDSEDESEDKPKGKHKGKGR